MFLIKNEDISILNTVSEGLFPILWIEEVNFRIAKENSFFLTFDFRELMFQTNTKSY